MKMGQLFVNSFTLRYCSLKFSLSIHKDIKSAPFNIIYSVLKEKFTPGKENASFLQYSPFILFCGQLCFVLLASTAAQGSREDG